jgi:hypothetical protein
MLKRSSYHEGSLGLPQGKPAGGPPGALESAGIIFPVDGQSIDDRAKMA